MKKISHSWEKLPSGLVVPVGTITDISEHAKVTYLSVKAKAEEIERLYATSRVDLPRSCDLGQLIQNAKTFWENWFMVQDNKLEMRMLFKILHLDRLANDILLLKDNDEKQKYLRAFASGNLDFFKREKSIAKNLLWEIEVWSRLRRKFSSVSLEEPPDIVMHFDEAKIGIACKKLYSEKHLQNVLSQAVSQIAETFEFGMVAINIDDLQPPDKLVKAPNRAQMDAFIQNLNAEFIQRHERHFRKYLSSGRLISAIISTNVIVDVEREQPRFNNASQWTIWNISGLAPEKNRQLLRFYEIVMQ